MERIPILVGFGGINAAGRSSGHHGYRRMVIDALEPEAAAATWQSLAALMQVANPSDETGRADQQKIDYLTRHTLVRKIEDHYFDPSSVAWNRPFRIRPASGPLCFEIDRRDLPKVLPEGWKIQSCDGISLERDSGTEGNGTVRVTVSSELELLMVDRRSLGVSSAGQLPTGFDPRALYAARSHPRAVQLTVFAASDALHCMGVDWSEVAGRVPVDQVSVYAGSAMGQLDEEGNGGLMGARYRGKRITSKHVPMGLAQMPADFVNAYILGSMGQTGHNMGACATFLYNLKQGMQDIRDGRSRVVLVGGVEAPLVPDVVEGLAKMGALGADRDLLALQGSEAVEPDYRRSCRPFGDNCGFTIAEGAQFAVLMDDELTLELGADIHAAIGSVFVHADGHKKSISSPGVGNYLTFAKAVACARNDLGENSVRRRSFVQAHGTGTPQNRTTESAIFDQVARAFDISDWPVAAIKCFVGHSMAAAGGDQLMASLGVWRYGIIPGIATIDCPADDVAGERLRISPDHLIRDPRELDVAFLNAKGFGGNNATASVLAPHVAEKKLREKHGAAKLNAWRHRVESTREKVAAYDLRASTGPVEVVYRFNHEVRSSEHVHIEGNELHIEGYAPVKLDDCK